LRAYTIAVGAEHCHLIGLIAGALNRAFVWDARILFDFWYLTRFGPEFENPPLGHKPKRYATGQQHALLSCSGLHLERSPKWQVYPELG
jgi:hypothetical protein